MCYGQWISFVNLPRQESYKRAHLQERRFWHVAVNLRCHFGLVKLSLQEVQLKYGQPLAAGATMSTLRTRLLVTVTPRHGCGPRRKKGERKGGGGIKKLEPKLGTHQVMEDGERAHVQQARHRHGQCGRICGQCGRIQQAARERDEEVLVVLCDVKGMGGWRAVVEGNVVVEKNSRGGG